MIEGTSSDKPGLDPVSKQLEAAGVQPTAQRIEIARVLLDRPRHLSADRISAILLERGVRVSKATVYNTLKLLCARGLAKAIIVDPNRVFYDSTTESHHHFYNVDSGELTDIPAEQVRFADLPALPRGTAQEGVDVIVRVRDKAP